MDDDFFATSVCYGPVTSTGRDTTNLLSDLSAIGGVSALPWALIRRPVSYGTRNANANKRFIENGKKCSTKNDWLCWLPPDAPGHGALGLVVMHGQVVLHPVMGLAQMPQPVLPLHPLGTQWALPPHSWARPEGLSQLLGIMLVGIMPVELALTALVPMCGVKTARVPGE